MGECGVHRGMLALAWSAKQRRVWTALDGPFDALLRPSTLLHAVLRRHPGGAASRSSMQKSPVRPARSSRSRDLSGEHKARVLAISDPWTPAVLCQWSHSIRRQCAFAERALEKVRQMRKRTRTTKTTEKPQGMIRCPAGCDEGALVDRKAIYGLKPCPTCSTSPLPGWVREEERA